MKTTTITLLASLLTLTTAQYTIDPSSVNYTTRAYWCSQQQAQCPLICLQTSAASSTTDSNTCDASSLTYACICSNGQSPNVSEYSQTLPFFICQEWGNQCVSNCGSDNSCASACRQDHPCGAQNPIKVNATMTMGAGAKKTGSHGLGASGTSAAAGSVCTGFGAGSCSKAGAAQSSAATDPQSGASALLDVGRSYGLVAVVSVLLGAFALAL